MEKRIEKTIENSRLGGAIAADVFLSQLDSMKEKSYFRNET
jgi:hypothetical protein